MGKDAEGTTAAEKNNKAYKQVRPYSEPTKFGGLMTMDLVCAR